jgi:hypothetical protein
MAQSWKCDKCKGFIHNTRDLVKITFEGGLRVPEWDESLNVCPDCYHDLIKTWLREKPRWKWLGYENKNLYK